jgi:hypothetical protein
MCPHYTLPYSKKKPAYPVITCAAQPSNLPAPGEDAYHMGTMMFLGVGMVLLIVLVAVPVVGILIWVAVKAVRKWWVRPHMPPPPLPPPLPAENEQPLLEWIRAPEPIAVSRQVVETTSARVDAHLSPTRPRPQSAPEEIVPRRGGWYHRMGD